MGKLHDHESKVIDGTPVTFLEVLRGGEVATFAVAGPLGAHEVPVHVWLANA